MPVMERYIDLHTHSNYSDGTDSPEELICKARDSGLCAVVLTDHDTVAGLDEIAQYGREYGIETVNGIELSSQMRDVEVHILGYCIEYKKGAMDNYLKRQEESRREKTGMILAKLRDLGFDISEEDFSGSQGIITRGSIAGVMHKKGFVRYKKEAFEKYIGEGRPAFADRDRIGVREAVELILTCGGIPVIAHPYLYSIDDQDFEYEVGRLVSIGLRGIEVLYPEGHDDRREAFYRYLAEKHSLLITGGSDYHGDNKTVKLGYAFNDERIPYELLEALMLSANHNGVVG